ncbi:MAG: acyltransferase [Dehalococcoidia bacterium]|jgi:acetyltransferase-like isoleucine patch superfamily enzyme
MIHPKAEVSPQAKVGPKTNVWSGAQIREGAVVGDECNIGKDVYIDKDVVVGNKVKIQNRASLYRGVSVEDGAFIGPHVAFINDRYPRSITPEGRVRTEDDWEPEPTVVRYGASIGAGSVIMLGVTIGRWAMVGAGSLVTRGVPEQALVKGSPARVTGYVCKCGHPLLPPEGTGAGGEWRCPDCGASYHLPPISE